ncbi:FMN-linked oxidoreductase [Cubamyces sp. BRFM 1775]|nr:FMN-linked oxidoreductase [Cubamyces sp. BRFM 1775]
MEALISAAASGVPYFTPKQEPIAGTAAPPKDGKSLPTLFQPLKIRDLEFHNRLFVAPMGLSSADHNGTVTPFHTAILGSVVMRGPGLTIMEATAVSQAGKITIRDGGLWSDEQVGPLRALVDFAHSQGQKIGVQLSHAGRKGSVAPMWVAGHAVVPASLGGAPEAMVAPSPVPYVPDYGKYGWKKWGLNGSQNAEPKGTTPKELSTQEVKDVVRQWAAAAKRAVDAGVDVIQIHGAHGYLLHQFLSPVSNKRTDEYGGSFENRARIVLEVADAIRAVIPEGMPLFLKLSATDWLEEVLPNEPSWTVEETARLSGLVAEHGVDLVDISSGGLDARQSFRFAAPAYHANLAEEVKKAVGDRILVGVAGGITTGKMAQEVLDKGQADIILVAKQFLRDPATVVTFAEDLGVEVKLPQQYDWVFHGRGSAWRWIEKDWY